MKINLSIEKNSNYNKMMTNEIDNFMHSFNEIFRRNFFEYYKHPKVHIIFNFYKKIMFPPFIINLF